jgi:hypothetical protein
MSGMDGVTDLLRGPCALEELENIRARCGRLGNEGLRDAALMKEPMVSEESKCPQVEQKKNMATGWPLLARR